MRTEPIAEVRGLRPADDGIENLWPSDERDAVLRQVLSSERRPRREDLRIVVSRARLRRPAVAAIAATVAVAAAVAVPTALSADRPAAGTHSRTATKLPNVTLVALQRLARVAATAPTDRRGPGQFWHMVVREQQTGPAGQPSSRTDMESWTSGDGHVWRRDVLTESTGVREVDTYLFPPGGENVDYPSPQYLNTLPTDPDALKTFLSTHVSGSSSPEEAVFVAIGTLLRGGFAPGALRSAAVRVLAQLPHVILGDATLDSLGRPAQEYDFVDESIRPGEVQSLFFDPATAQIREDELSASGDGSDVIVDSAKAGHPAHVRTLDGALHYTGSVLSSDVVDAVPQDIRDAAVPQHG